MHVQTGRLVVTRFTPDMAQQVHLLSLDDDTRRFVPDEVFETEEEARETLEYLIDRYGKTDGPLAYAVLLNGEYIGYVQLVPMDDGMWEIGYHIGKLYTGKGYAAEAVNGFLPEMMPRLGLTEVRGICLTENTASIRVLQKCGFRQIFSGKGAYQGCNREICVFTWTFSP